MTEQSELPLDQDALDLASLAQAILDRRVRPRVGSIRRLAEAVLAKGGKKRKKGKKKAAKKVRTLATIPGQKGKKSA